MIQVFLAKEEYAQLLHPLLCTAKPKNSYDGRRYYFVHSPSDFDFLKFIVIGGLKV
jgi:hypothetical protein